MREWLFPGAIASLAFMGSIFAHLAWTHSRIVAVLIATVFIIIILLTTREYLKQWRKEHP